MTPEACEDQAATFDRMLEAQLTAWEAGQPPGSDMFRSLAAVMVRTLAPVAVWLNTQGAGLPVAPATLAPMLQFDRMVALLLLGQWTRPDGAVLDAARLIVQAGNRAAALDGWERATYPLRLYLRRNPDLDAALWSSRPISAWTDERAGAVSRCNKLHGYLAELAREAMAFPAGGSMARKGR